MKNQLGKPLPGKSVANPKVASDMKMSSLPMVENVRPPCNGKKGVGSSRKPPHHKGSSCHQVIPGFTAGNGIGVEVIYSSMSVEKKVVKMDTGPRSNGSQFIISTTKTERLVVKNGAFMQLP